MIEIFFIQTWAVVVWGLVAWVICEFVTFPNMAKLLRKVLLIMTIVFWLVWPVRGLIIYLVRSKS